MRESLNAIINSVYVIPILLEYFTMNPGEPEEVGEPYLRVFAELGISLNDLEVLRSLTPLLQYHLYQVKSDFKPNYELLVKGLRKYFDNVLIKMWEDLGLTGMKGKTLLDYGAGSGYYSEAFLAHNPGCHAFRLDRHHEVEDEYHVAVDFEKVPDWYTRFPASFDYVLLSEILHCKDRPMREYLIKSSMATLKKGGLLIINENQDPFMNYRLKKLTDGKGGMVTDAEIHRLAIEHGNLGIKHRNVYNYHHVYAYERV